MKTRMKTIFPTGAAIVWAMLANPTPVCGDWTNLLPRGVTNSSMGCVYDSYRSRGVMFGGNDADNYQVHGRTYEWNGESWQLAATNGPLARANHALAFDKQRHRVVLFGGWTTPNDYCGDTWEWDGGSWVYLAVPGPGARANCAIAYDSQRAKTVLFGGSYYETIYGDTWEWNGNLWTNMGSSGPGPRIFAAAAYDESRHRVVLFGGQTTYYGTFLNDTWVWDGTRWTLVATNGPSARAAHAMAYDPIGKRIVLFGGGGWGRPEQFNDTWEWAGTAWKMIPDYGPAPRQYAGMFFDAQRQGLIVQGGWSITNGIYADTWQFAEFMLRAAIRVSQVEICWNSVTNATYEVQYRSELTTNIWTPLKQCVSGSASNTCVQDAVPTGAPQKFYRVILKDCVP